MNVQKTNLVSNKRKSQKEGVLVYKENPFWESYEVRVGKRFIRVAGGFHVSEETGETIQHSGIHIVEEKDEDEFVKLYTRNIKIFFDLKPTSLKVLQVLLHTIQQNPGADSIHLHWFEVEEYSKLNDLKISRTAFHSALKEMIVKGFIAEAEVPNKYWINPHLFFNGDRMVFVREYRKSKQPKAPNRSLDADGGDSG